MTESTSKVLCGSCKVPVELVVDADPLTVRCPSCGITETSENAIREASEHALEMVALRIDKTFADTAKGNTFVKFTSKPIPHRSYKFVTDLQL
jgi:hypothetical protein